MLELLRVVTGDNRYAEIEKSVKRRLMKGESISMCEVLDRYWQRGVQEGVCITIRNMLARGMSDEDICAIAECKPELVQKVRKGLQQAN